jgi:hypothetical protein
MSLNQISYSFFGPKKSNEHRWYDKHLSDERYWYNIPAIIALNKLFYPDFELKFYISPDIKDNTLYKVIEESINKIEGVSAEVMYYDYLYTEPTMWRYKPIVESSVDVLLCRDIDSIPNEDEIKSTYYFLNDENFKITTIRSNKHHNCDGTIILAGLCGFRTKDTEYPNNNFDEFYQNFKIDKWGVDQSFLINFLKSKGSSWILNHFLDSRISNADNVVLKSRLNCTSNDEIFYRNNVKIDFDDDLIKLINSITSWPGEPVSVRGGLLLELLKFDKYESISIIKDILMNDINLKKFYLEC